MTPPAGGGRAGLPWPEPRWLEPATPDPDRVARLREVLSLPHEVCALLVTRGYASEEEAKRFLRPRLEHLLDPSGLADGLLAAERIADAIRRRARILVHGDYDVDGICATALTTRWVRTLGGDAIPFVPRRLTDGYDLSKAGVAAAVAAGASLIVTVDCGTLAFEPIELARSQGIDVVVIDHHTTAAHLPRATALVNPMRPDCAYLEKGLCGTAVAYKVCELVGRILGSPVEELHRHLDLVALAAVADLVPLTGENRVLVSYGLRRLAETLKPGLRALMEVAGVDPGTVGTTALGFSLAPRINAAGRIGDPSRALTLLLTEDPDEARGIATELDALNAERKAEDQRTLSEALDLLERDYDPDRDRGVVLASEGWHPGVIGIVASRVVERIHRPVVLVALDGDRGRGSARSIHGFHLYEALHGCAGLLLRFGGHRQAAGLDLERERLPEFRAAFNAEAHARLEPEALSPVHRPDLELDPTSIDLDLLHWLGYLGPHGMGNPAPLFASRGVEVREARTVGTNHLRVALQAGSRRIDGIGFGLSDRFAPDQVRGAAHDVLYRLERNEWRGVVKPQARMVDLRPAPRP